MSAAKLITNFFAKPSFLRSTAKLRRDFSAPFSSRSYGSASYSINRPVLGRRKLLGSRKTPFLCQCSMHTQTGGDKELAHFLKEEISYEQENVMEVPKFRDFKLEMDETLIKLTRNFNSELIEVSFDINDNVNVDEEVELEEHDDANINTPDIVSYPIFAIKIVRQSGQTLHFNCSCNTQLNEEELESESPEDEQFDLFRFDNVKIYNGSEGEKSAYEAETETMDGELYSMLMTTLLERGITGAFVNDLIDLSTSAEHRHYLNFLKSLRNFAAGK